MYIHLAIVDKEQKQIKKLVTQHDKFSNVTFLPSNQKT